MLEVYNDAWNDNWGYVPFTREEFFKNVDDMQLIMEKGLFLFVYVKGELRLFLAAFLISSSACSLRDGPGAVNCCAL